MGGEGECGQLGVNSCFDYISNCGMPWDSPRGVRVWSGIISMTISITLLHATCSWASCNCNGVAPMLVARAHARKGCVARQRKAQGFMRQGAWWQPQRVAHLGMTPSALRALRTSIIVAPVRSMGGAVNVG